MSDLQWIFPRFWFIQAPSHGQPCWFDSKSGEAIFFTLFKIHRFPWTFLIYSASLIFIFFSLWQPNVISSQQIYDASVTNDSHETVQVLYVVNEHGDEPSAAVNDHAADEGQDDAHADGDTGNGSDHGAADGNEAESANEHDHDEARIDEGHVDDRDLLATDYTQRSIIRSPEHASSGVKREAIFQRYPVSKRPKRRSIIFKPTARKSTAKPSRLTHRRKTLFHMPVLTEPSEECQANYRQVPTYEQKCESLDDNDKQPDDTDNTSETSDSNINKLMEAIFESKHE